LAIAEWALHPLPGKLFRNGQTLLAIGTEEFHGLVNLGKSEKAPPQGE
jgi:hypothetical protein